ncbi:tryptophan halogenase family protein [Paraburkholderia mimosarum]|uniref:tryptophan halogenase family protein n=1 Tax=Paraburkholderia mimosarum TaxID=312026 RepID=UPI0039C3C8A2
MLNLNGAKRIVVVGGGTAGWFAALTLRSMFGPQAEVVVLESPRIGIVGVGEGGLLNLVDSLKQLNIPVDEFARETGAAYKLGFLYEGWRDGSEGDAYYHMFVDSGIEEIEWKQYGFYPLVSTLTHFGIELSQALPGFQVIAKQGSQEDARRMLADPACGIRPSWHFDSQRIAAYLKRVALSRGIVHKLTEVSSVQFDETRRATAVQTTDESIAVDFLVDASGLSRLVVGKALQGEWQSFSDYLLLDRAIPFHMPHPKANPYLVTRAIAMSAGWVWQIPLLERVGAGYVFSSRHIDEDAAVAEIERRIGMPIEPSRTLHFEPGHFKEVWQRNVMTIGLASGFVEPLEATSIGQMLEQLRNFRRVVLESGGVVSEEVIGRFNESNARYWLGIRDFLRMHYDCPRRDTPFWRDVAQTPLPDSWRALKACMQQRLPRPIDTEGYYSHPWTSMFHSLSWVMVAAPLGLISREAAFNDMQRLPADTRQRIADYMFRKWPHVVSRLRR